MENSNWNNVINHRKMNSSQNTRQANFLRQDRFEAKEGTCYVVISNKTFEVANYSYFGLGIKSDSPIDDEVIKLSFQNVPFVICGVHLTDLNLKLTRHTPEDNFYVIGFEIVGEPLCIDRIKAVQRSQSVTKAHLKKFSSASNIPVKFKADVLFVKDWLEQFHKQIEISQSHEVLSTHTDVEGYEDTFAKVSGSFIGQHLNSTYQSMTETLKGASDQTIKESVTYLRERLREFLDLAPFSQRCLTRPLGYAGDFEMMEQIYSNKTIGQSLFAKCLQQYFIQEPAAQAVRNRGHYLIKKLVQLTKKADRKLKILSVACGPANEVARFIADHSQHLKHKVSFDLLDQDLIALKHAQKVIHWETKGRHENVQVNFMNLAIKDIIIGGLDSNQYDLIYSAGLFDYFSDPVAQKAAEKLFKSLNFGGQLIIGNFDVSNPTRTLMDLALNWKLTYRTEHDMKQLFSNLSPKVTVEKEESGINLFSVIEK